MGNTTKHFGRGKTHHLGDELDETECAVLRQAIDDLRTPLLKKWRMRKAIRRQEWAELLEGLTDEQREQVRLSILTCAKEDPTLGRSAKGVGRAFTVATGIQWTTGKVAK